jgi:hypothetical protein
MSYLELECSSRQGENMRHPSTQIGKPTRRQKLVHSLNNSLSALRLRLDLIAADPTCMWAQRENVAGMNRILESARRSAGRLEADIEKSESGLPPPKKVATARRIKRTPVR